jgi:hypothetical protein
MRQRRETVEHPFGTIKARMGATHFLMKTLPRVASEMALHVLAYKSHPCDEHHGRSAAHSRDQGIIKPEKCPHHYRMNAAECLSAAERCDPAYRGLTLAIAASWLSLACQQEAVDGLLAIWSKAQSPAPIRPAAFSALRGTAGQMGNCLKGGQQDLEIFMSSGTYNRARTADRYRQIAAAFASPRATRSGRMANCRLGSDRGPPRCPTLLTCQAPSRSPITSARSKRISCPLHGDGDVVNEAERVRPAKPNRAHTEPLRPMIVVPGGRNEFAVPNSAGPALLCVALKEIFHPGNGVLPCHANLL